MLCYALLCSVFPDADADGDADGDADQLFIPSVVKGDTTSEYGSKEGWNR